VTTILGEAPENLIKRYQKAIYRLLNREYPNIANEVFSEIQLKIVAGDLEKWKPDPGKRFRDYFVTTIRNAAIDHLRRNKSYVKRMQELLFYRENRTSASPTHPNANDSLDSELMNKALRELSKYQGARNRKPGSRTRQRPNLYATILRLRRKHKNLTDLQLIERLPRQWREKYQAKQWAFYKQVERARQLFAAFLVLEVACPYHGDQAKVSEKTVIDQAKQLLTDSKEVQDELEGSILTKAVACLFPKKKKRLPRPARTTPQDH